MKRLAKNFILTTTALSAIFFVDPATAFCERFSPLNTPQLCQMDFWSKFRDTVMPDKPQDNNPPKEMRKPKPHETPRHKNHKPRK